MKLKKLFILIISVVTGTSTVAQQGQAVNSTDPLSGTSESRSTPSDPEPFTFVQICDPQLGMGGYEHDLKTFRQAVIQTNALKPDFVVMHHPLYTDKPDEKNGYYNLPKAKRTELLELFEKHGVVAVLTGYAHKVIIREHKGIQLVTGETTSKTHGSPLGFRLWHIKEPRPYKHESVRLKGF